MSAAADRQALFAGTRSIAPGLSFDSQVLESYLGECLPHFSGPLRVAQF